MVIGRIYIYDDINAIVLGGIMSQISLCVFSYRGEISILSYLKRSYLHNLYCGKQKKDTLV